MSYMLKFSSETEFYAKCVKEKKDQSAMAKFHSGVAPLQIEIGHYNGVDVQHRLCILCDKNEIEDECHLLVTCMML